jgi:hypothetical protein
MLNNNQLTLQQYFSDNYQILKMHFAYQFRTTFVSALFRKFGSCFGILDIAE